MQDGAQNKIKIFYQQNPARATTYGQRVENHHSVVPDLEDEHPVLKLCSENWGAKWILKRAKQAVAVKGRNGGTVARQRKAKRQARVADPGAQGPLPELGVEPGEIDHEAKGPELPAIDMMGSGEDMDGGKRMPLVEGSRSCTARLGCLEPDHQKHSFVDQAACTALFNASKSWLVTGPPGYDLEVQR